MAKTTLNPSNARKNFYQLLKNVNQDHKEIQIISEIEENNVILVSLDDWQSIQETLMLKQTSVLDEVRKREKDGSGFTNFDDIDWDML